MLKVCTLTAENHVFGIRALVARGTDEALPVGPERVCCMGGTSCQKDETATFCLTRGMHADRCCRWGLSSPAGCTGSCGDLVRWSIIQPTMHTQSQEAQLKGKQRKNLSCKEPFDPFAPVFGRRGAVPVHCILHQILTNVHLHPLTGPHARWIH